MEAVALFYHSDDEHALQIKDKLIVFARAGIHAHKHKASMHMLHAFLPVSGSHF